MRGFLTLLFIFVTFSSLLGCGDDKSGGDLLQPLEETEMLEEELVDVTDVDVTDEVDVDQGVAEVLLYGTDSVRNHSDRCV